MSLFRKKRAQAAVELLTTYGWAIMGVILVIGALSYFDVFDSTRFISERCDTGNQIQCLESYAKTDGQFLIAIRNNYLVDIVVEGVYVDGEQMVFFDGTYYTGDTSAEMASGNVSEFGIEDMNANFIKGDKKTMDVLIRFRRNIASVNDCDDGICYNTSGTLVVKVQDVIAPRTED